MLKNANLASTHEKGWETRCRKWAKAGVQFELLDIEATHFVFCQEICAAYKYKYEYQYSDNKSFAAFVPRDCKIPFPKAA